ncbi:TcfC E-set like domain-containing protein [Vibrio alfacsensis]|uniref:TcfC E-set like domain-containing protein n=1 Tax=Vibrio alfacsensis TaxID=1074311 RepID=UPI001BEE7826|nr:TcfC E-set like domain-containing protein [Vibrio alfacsensis]WQE75089.1 TcfC E-set like domain-containing protein [Vibrio alfacsensis]BCN24314.1 hypothetical protein VYA_15060 [Vibrio alfacsensis]
MKLNKLTIAIFMFPSVVANASDYPLEFADFFEEQLRNVEVVISGETLSERIFGYVNFDSFRLDIDEKNRNTLVSYLTDRKVNASAIEKIVASLVEGVNANPGCKGEISYCIPKIDNQTAVFTYDYDNNVLRIFPTSSSLISGSDSIQYYDGLRQDNALINNSKLYASSSNDQNNVSLNNSTLLGVPYGYVETTNRLSNDNDSFELYSARYIGEVGRTRVEVGYQSQHTSDNFNSTDSLRYGANFSGTQISIGSSRNLLIGKDKSTQRIYFFAPQSGTLEVYRGTRLLLTRTVYQGENSIGYDELPGGVYDLNIVVKRGDERLLDEQRTVVNNNRYQLDVGGIDYRLAFGELEKADITHTYVYSAASYRNSEKIIFAGGLGSDGDDNLIQLGATYTLDGDSNVQFSGGYFDDQSHYLQAQMQVGPFLAYGKEFKPADGSFDEKKDFASVLYGEGGFDEIGLSYSSNILGGSGFINLSSANYELDKEYWRTNSLSLTWSRKLFGGDFSVNATLSESEYQEQLMTMVNWSHHLGENSQISTSATMDKNGLSQTQLDVQHLYESDSWSARSSIGTRRDQENSDFHGTASINGKNEFVQYDAYGYAASDGDYSVSGSLESSQILTQSKAWVTSESSQSYLYIEPKTEGNEPIEAGRNVYYNLVRDDDLWLSNKVATGTQQVHSLPSYVQLDVKLDAELEGIEIAETSKRFFVQPGTVFDASPEITSVESQIIVLNNMFGEPIRQASCVGDGCKGVEPVSDDGIFRLNYIAEKPFKLVSSRKLCVYDAKAFGNAYVNSYCLEGLDDAGIDDAIVLSTTADGIEVGKVSKQGFIYLGRYRTSEEAELILERLREVNLLTHHVSVGENLYVYVKHPHEYTVAQSSLLESLEKYAIYDAIDQEQQFGIR